MGNADRSLRLGAKRWEILASFGAAACGLTGAVFVFPLMVGARFAVTLCYLAAFVFSLYGVIGLLSLRYASFRLIRRLVWALFGLWLVSFAVAEGFIWHGARSDAQDGAAYIIVLGAGLWGETPSPTLHSRLTAALDYLRANPETVAIVTGGQGPDESIPEAEAGFRFFVQNGMDPSRIWKEDLSRDTDENIRFAARMIREGGGQDLSAVVCSSEFHIFRARVLARRNGLDASGLAAPTPYWHLRILYAIREYFSVLFMFLPYKPVL